jgi:hypothetical protein
MPPRRQPRAANDNRADTKPAQRFMWDVYRAAARARWVGQVIAITSDEAVASAAIEFNTDVKKLIAVRRYEIAG